MHPIYALNLTAAAQMFNRRLCDCVCVGGDRDQCLKMAHAISCMTSYTMMDALDWVYERVARGDEWHHIEAEAARLLV